MKKEMFKKWLKVLNKTEKKNKELLKNKRITKDNYILLNRINSDKYNQIIRQYHQELASNLFWRRDLGD